MDSDFIFYAHETKAKQEVEAGIRKIVADERLLSFCLREVDRVFDEFSIASSIRTTPENPERATIDGPALVGLATNLKVHLVYAKIQEKFHRRHLAFLTEQNEQLKATIEELQQATKEVEHGL